MNLIHRHHSSTDGAHVHQFEGVEFIVFRKVFDKTLGRFCMSGSERTDRATKSLVAKFQIIRHVMLMSFS